MPKPCIGSRLSVLSLLFAAEFVSAQRVKQLGHAIVEFTSPGKGVQDSFVTNQDDVASGDLFFKSAGGGWASGTYRLVMSHPDAKAELPIELD
jgi:hypothetical protein